MLLNSPELKSYLKEATRIVMEGASDFEIGHLNLLRGVHKSQTGYHEEALLSFSVARENLKRAGVRDDLARTDILLSREFLWMGKIDLHRRQLRMASQNLRGMTVSLLLAEYELLRLESAYLTRTKKNLRTSIATCGVVAGSIVDVYTRLRVLRQLGRAHARLGNHADLERTFQEFANISRSVVANLESPASASGFLEGIEFSGFLMESQRMKGEGPRRETRPFSR
jgi:hypothetical protein